MFNPIRLARPVTAICPRLAPLAATALLVMSNSWAQAQPADSAPKLPPDSIQAQTSGRISLQPQAYTPVFAEFDRSPTLTKALVAALQERGIALTTDKASARATLTISGDLVLLGGPVFYKGVKVPMGEATEKTLAAAAAKRGMSGAEAANAGVTVALERAAFLGAASPFWAGLAAGRMAEVLGDATGMRGAFNTALTGDPRGICLSRCEDWKKVKQSAYTFVTLTTTDGKQQARVLATAFSETLAPDEVIAQALAKALAAIDLPPVERPAMDQPAVNPPASQPKLQ